MTQFVFEDVTFEDYRKGNFNNTSTPAYKTIYENENVIARQSIYSGDVQFEFKSNCDKRVIDIWNKLNNPKKSEKQHHILTITRHGVY